MDPLNNPPPFPRGSHEMRLHQVWYQNFSNFAEYFYNNFFCRHRRRYIIPNKKRTPRKLFLFFNSTNHLYKIRLIFPNSFHRLINKMRKILNFCSNIEMPKFEHPRTRIFQKQSRQFFRTISIRL